MERNKSIFNKELILRNYPATKFYGEDEDDPIAN